MPSRAIIPDTAGDAALALFLPLIERLDQEHRAQGVLLAGALNSLRSDPATELPPSPDPRLQRQLDLMRQGFMREAAAGPGALFQSWSDLHNHLRFAYAPLGRALGEQHSEATIAQPPLEALTLAIGLAVLLQEAPRRLRESGRIVLPVQWFPAGTPIETWLRSSKRSAALDTAYGQALARLEELLNVAERGLTSIHNPSLRQGAKAALFLLRRLQKRLHQRTPNVRPVALGFFDRLLLRFS